MKFPFSKNQNYFTPSEQKHLDDFLAVEPIGDDTWTNDKGETRRVMRIEWPQGIDFGAGRTVYFKNPKTNIIEYHSPCATFAGKTARLMYTDQNGECAWCTSLEWLKWAGKSFTAESPEIPVKTEAQVEKEKAMMGMVARSTQPPSSGDDFSKGGKWSKKRK